MSIWRPPHHAGSARRSILARPAAGDLRTAVLWVLAVVPQAFGFWLVAGDVAGVQPGQTRTFVLAAMLTLGLATLAQVVVGYRLTLYEGPAAAYLAAVVVVAAGGHGLAAIGAGLLVGGATVALLGVLRFDRLLLRVFTPLTGMVFVLVVTVAVLPTTVARALATSHVHPWGTTAGWVAALAVVAVGVGLQRPRVTRPYALLVALLVGAAAAIAVGGVPHADLSGGLALPSALPWGAPQFSVQVIVPFVIAAGLIAFNTVAAVEVGSAMQEVEKARLASARGLVVHGAVQAVGALAGNVLGTVARLDSVPIVQLLGNRRRTALAIAALLVMALALVQPFLGLVAALPLTVSAALLALMFCSMIVQTLQRLWPLGAHARMVAAVALAPSIAWTPLQHLLSPTAKLLGNPMLWGVAAGLVLERVLERRTGRAPATALAERA
ncbi:solute carrier family 23 protein [Baekduia soli]|uniref:solute carrier family 23 protein n=1 Tax=Baekduia soli TaxID=496014 RepID=UPI001651E136|nr:solute carrier family 23 protein [Baekduia soli]